MRQKLLSGGMPPERFSSLDCACEPTWRVWPFSSSAAARLLNLLSAPLMIPLVAVISRASDEHPGVARLWPGGENKIGRRTSHQEELKAIGAFLLPRAATGVSLVAV